MKSKKERKKKKKIETVPKSLEASMLLKEHKKDLATRPVVSGCDSNTLGLSNMVSEFIDAVANSIDNPYEVISTEDLLARVHEFNIMMTILREEKISKGKDITEKE